MKMIKWLVVAVLGLPLLGCFDSDDDDDPASPALTSSISTTEINAAADYIDESLPEYGSANASAYLLHDMKYFALNGIKQLSPIQTAHAAADPSNTGTATATLSDAWDGSTADTLIGPPGGFPQDNETYPSSFADLAGQDVEYVNLKNYMGYQLRSDFQRESGDEGPYKPTLFGRFEGAIFLVNILSQIFPNGFEPGDAIGYAKLEDGSPVIATEDEEDAFQVNLTVVDISAQSDFYDVALRVSSDTVGFDDRMWLRSSDSQLNFQHLEYALADEEVTDTYRASVTTLHWNKASGELAFEYVSTEDDDYSDQNNGNIMRFYVAEEGGDAWLVGFEGSTSGNDTENEYKVFSLASSGGDNATEASLSVAFNTQDKDSNAYYVADEGFCVSMANGNETTGCTGLDEVDVSGESFPAFITNVISKTTTQQILNAYGIEAWTEVSSVNIGSAPQYTDNTDISSGFD